MSYTERFTERVALLATVLPPTAAQTSEVNTSWISVANYRRIAIVLLGNTVGTTLDVDIEVATDSSASNLATLKSITQVTAADTLKACIEIHDEELNIAGVEHDYIRVEITPSGNNYVAAVVLGLEPTYVPVDVTAWDEIVD